MRRALFEEAVAAIEATDPTYALAWHGTVNDELQIAVVRGSDALPVVLLADTTAKRSLAFATQYLQPPTATPEGSFYAAISQSRLARLGAPRSRDALADHVRSHNLGLGGLAVVTAFREFTVGGYPTVGPFVEVAETATYNPETGRQEFWLGNQLIDVKMSS